MKFEDRLFQAMSEAQTTQFPKKLTGIKHDSGKPDISLLPTEAIFEVAKVMDYGKQKYSANNWRGGFAWTRVSSAVLRHIFSWLKGEDNDPETGLSHLAHAACGLMFLITFEKTNSGTDDRYKGGNNAD